MAETLQHHLLGSHNTQLHSYSQEHLVSSAPASTERTLKKKRKIKEIMTKTKRGKFSDGPSVAESRNEEEVLWMAATQPEVSVGPTDIKHSQGLESAQCEKEIDMKPVKSELSTESLVEAPQPEHDSNILQHHLVSSHRTQLHSSSQTHLVSSAPASTERTLKKKRKIKEIKTKTKRAKFSDGPRVAKSRNKEEILGETAAQPEIVAVGAADIEHSQALESNQCEKEVDMKPVKSELSTQSLVEAPHLEHDANGAVEDGCGAVIITDDPEDKCQFICGICQRHVTSLRCHVGSFHQLSPKEYRSIYPHPDTFVRKTHHRYSFVIVLF
jgi:hypothetical protein